MVQRGPVDHSSQRKNLWGVCMSGGKLSSFECWEPVQDLIRSCSNSIYPEKHEQRIEYVIQNCSLDIQHTYSSEFSSGQSTYEIPFLIWYEAMPLYFFQCPVWPPNITFEINFQISKKNVIWSSDWWTHLYNQVFHQKLLLKVYS